MRVASFGSGVVVLMTVLLCAHPSLAQKRSKNASASEGQAHPTVVEARELFDEALVHLREGRAAVGLDLLRRSLVLYPTVATRYNLGVALRLTGKTNESIATFQGLLRDELDPQQVKRIEEQLAEAEADLATVRVRVTGVPTARLELDGREIAEVGENQSFSARVDAGEHVLIAYGEGSSGRKTVDVPRGGTADVELAVIPIGQPGAEQRRKRRIAWITSAVAVAAIATTLAVVLTRRDTEPITDPVTGRVDGALQAAP